MYTYEYMCMHMDIFIYVNTRITYPKMDMHQHIQTICRHGERQKGKRLGVHTHACMHAYMHTDRQNYITTHCITLHYIAVHYIT